MDKLEPFRELGHTVIRVEVETQWGIINLDFDEKNSQCEVDLTSLAGIVRYEDGAEFAKALRDLAARCSI